MSRMSAIRNVDRRLLVAGLAFVTVSIGTASLAGTATSAEPNAAASNTAAPNPVAPTMPKLVLPKSADVRLLDVDGKAGVLPVGLVLGVLKVRGDFYDVGRGELLAEDVVAVDEAVDFFTREIARTPTPFAYVSRARALVQRGAHPEAVQSCRQALALAPDYAPAHCVLGRALTKLQQFYDALDALDRAAALDGASGFIYCTRAQTHRAMNNPAAALADFERAIKLDDRLVSAYFGRGSVLAEFGDDDAALRDFATVVSMYPAYYYALNERANIWLRREAWQQACDDYTAALQFSNRAELRVNRATALRGLGRYVEAVAECDAAIQLDPQLKAAHRLRALLLTEIGKAEEAQPSLDQTVQLPAVDIRA
ncbi:MAG: hypothetical protein C0483_22190 [Pirellula sp.]|nr:hypothetical protein [Pirellula sp.]